ncbi:hypothetical protein LshimejAT787_0705480 [Lyophyllum shimeji]|uniref:Fungal-type protein kinase domain-containing protein n=1 Tax=Lyophyllum shimeji TaxID=47721 RepID=A0A9P3PR32_LYOSH|nr:hypothetical protein LshimejAT787_0705480 [Lyophyllum shimeji]
MPSTANASSLSGSPIKFAASNGFESTRPDLAEARTKMKDAMSGLFVGPMPVNQFLQEFLPQPVSAPLPSGVPANLFAAMPITKKERHMYEPFIKLVNEYGLIPNYQIVNTADHHDSATTSGDHKIKPDPVMYKADVDTSTKRTQFGEIELHFEFKVNHQSDPFADPKRTARDKRAMHQFEALAGQRAESRSQLIHYATEWFNRQHRRFAFSIFIGDPFVRFIRWDRAGAVVSEAFDYRENSQPLIEFLWRFTHHDDAGRGRDPTVRLATAEEIALARPHLEEWKPEKERPFIVFKVPDLDGKPREFIAWGSMSHAGSLTGRCTRAYPVYEVATGKRYFLKDTWRAHDLAKEADILRELQAARVQYIPPYVCGGDLHDDITMTDLYIPDEEPEAEANEEPTSDDPPPHVSESTVASQRPKLDGSWRCGSDWSRITQRYHHRFIVDFIGKPLTQVTSSKHLLQAISHAFTAHRQAYESKGKWIHRDISANNILIDANGNGILNDWDLAKRESELKRVRRHERTGTWQFMSCLLLSGHHSIHTIQDDMESFVYVVLYHGLRYFLHSESHSVGLHLQDVFEYRRKKDDGTSVGGKNKRRMMSQGTTFLGPDFHFDSRPLTSWLKEAFRAVKQWIDHVEPPTLVDEESILDTTPGEASPTAPPSSTSAKKLHLKDHAALTFLFSHCLSMPKWPDDRPVNALPFLERRTRPSTQRLQLDRLIRQAEQDNTVRRPREKLRKVVVGSWLHSFNEDPLAE